MKILRLLPRGMAAAALLLGAGCGSPPKPAAAEPAKESPAKILAFYPRETMVKQGEATVLCYGVSDAKSVRIDPPVDGVWPALNRCVEVRPKGETLYTLTAEGADGKSVTQSVSIHVGADTAALPKITSFQVIGKKKDYAGQTVFTVSFAVQNAVEVSIDPPAFPPLHGAPSGTFYVKPDKTTTYTLTVKGKNGQVARRKLTVEPGEGK